MTPTLTLPTPRLAHPIRRQRLTDCSAQVLLGDLAAFARIFVLRRPLLKRLRG